MTLELLVLESLKWLGEKAADAVIADPLKGEVKKFAEGREPRRQLQESIETALAETRKQFPYFDSQIDIDRLIHLVVTFAFLPPLLASPDYDRLMASWRISGDTKLARQILSCFFPLFRKEWESQPAFASLRGPYEAHLARLSVEQLTQAAVASSSAILDR